MEASLTVAIPTMDRWDTFLKDQLRVYLEHPRVECVIISDENGNDLEKISESEFAMDPKLRLYQNDSVMGVYGNKRQCLLRASTNWVAVLDSDNQFQPEFFNAFFSAAERDCDKKTIYCAGQNVRYLMDRGMTEDRTCHFSGMRISRENWNRVIEMPSWNFLLNDGNAIWPREVVKHFPDMPEERIAGTDSVFFMRQAVQAGYTLCVEPAMRYIHTVHDGSHWLQNEQHNSQMLANMFLNI